MEQQGEIPLKIDKNLTVNLTATVEDLNKPFRLSSIPTIHQRAWENYRKSVIADKTSGAAK